MCSGGGYQREGTVMRGTPAVDEDSKLIAEPRASLDGWLGRLMSEQIGSSVYATHWQMRSGFFDGTSKSAEHNVDWRAPPKT
jgi:hypothetical protein